MKPQPIDVHPQDELVVRGDLLPQQVATGEWSHLTSLAKPKTRQDRAVNRQLEIAAIDNTASGERHIEVEPSEVPQTRGVEIESEFLPQFARQGLRIALAGIDCAAETSPMPGKEYIGLGIAVLKKIATVLQQQDCRNGVAGTESVSRVEKRIERYPWRRPGGCLIPFHRHARTIAHSTWPGAERFPRQGARHARRCGSGGNMISKSCPDRSLRIR
jgi:hypothetical protein